MRGVLIDERPGRRASAPRYRYRAPAPRRAKRPVDLIGSRLKALNPRVGGRSPDIESRLRGFGKATSHSHASAQSRLAAPANAASHRRHDAPPRPDERRDGRAAAGRCRALALARQRVFFQGTSFRTLIELAP